MCILSLLNGRGVTCWIATLHGYGSIPTTGKKQPDFYPVILPHNDDTAGGPPDQ